MGSSSKKTTTGYKYFMGLHFGIAHGPVDEVQQITVGEREAWSGTQTASGSVVVNAPGLFGGDTREGGIVGVLDVAMGESTQGQNSYLSGLLGAGIPAFAESCLLYGAAVRSPAITLTSSRGRSRSSGFCRAGLAERRGFRQKRQLSLPKGQTATQQ